MAGEKLYLNDDWARWLHEDPDYPSEWKTVGGHSLRLTAMSLEHLENCLAKIEREKWRLSWRGPIKREIARRKRVNPGGRSTPKRCLTCNKLGHTTPTCFVIRQSCPTCNAPAGERCRRLRGPRAGEPVNKYHEARWRKIWT